MTDLPQITTCEDSIAYWGLCCVEPCERQATRAVLDDRMVEHAWCDEHTAHAERAGLALAVKPLQWRVG